MKKIIILLFTVLMLFSAVSVFANGKKETEATTTTATTTTTTTTTQPTVETTPTTGAIVMPGTTTGAINLNNRATINYKGVQETVTNTEYNELSKQLKQYYENVTSEQILIYAIGNKMIEIDLNLMAASITEEDMTNFANMLLQQFAEQVAYQYGVYLQTLEDVQAFVEEEMGVSFEDFANSVINDNLFSYLYYDYITAVYSESLNACVESVTDEVLADVFAETYPEGIPVGPFVEISDIAVAKANPEANSIIQEAYKKLAGGESFETVAATYSEEVNAAEGGKIDSYYNLFYLQNIFGFSEASCSMILGMKKGDYAIFYDGTDAYHIIKVDAFHEAEALGLDDILDPNNPETTVKDWFYSYYINNYIEFLIYDVFALNMPFDIVAANPDCYSIL